MKADQIDTLLRLGKEAAKNGDQTQARESFLAVIAADEANEEAWLWLSSVVESDEDKRICLENVLVINPENAAAKRGILKLSFRAPGEGEPDEQYTVRKEYAPISPAAAILYPGQEIKERSWTEPVIQQQPINPGFQSQSGFDDVWEQEGEICPYCAAELGLDDWSCPECNRKLKQSQYRYPEPGSDLLIFLVLILGIAQLSFILILMNLVVGKSLMALIWQTLVFITMFVLAAGIHFRRFWSYVGSIIALIMVFITLLLDIIIQPEAPGLLDIALAEDFFKALAENPYVFAVDPLIDLVVPLQLLAVILALLYALLRVGPDFERVIGRQVAQIDKDVSGASMFYARGKKYSGQNMWANAILHFQRAAAIEPTRIFYLSTLGDGYARLGYYQRSLDVLESAQRLTIDPQKQEELAGQIRAVRGLQEFDQQADGVDT